MNQQPDKLIPALYGGVIMGLLSAIPFVNLINCFCCAGVILGGIIAVYFYKNNFSPDTPPFTAGDCLLVGLMAGFVGAFVGTALSLIVAAMFGDIMREFAQNVLLNSNLNIPDDLRAKLEEAFAQKSRTGAMVIVSYVFALIIDMIFGIVGGLIGYGIFKPKAEAMPPMPKPS
jgi:hypothetical protein